MVSVQTAYVSAGCNRFSHAADTDPNDGLVVFGCGALVCFWDSAAERSCVHQGLVGHSANITAVRFVDANTTLSNLASRVIVSADTAGCICIWSESKQASTSANIVDWELVLSFNSIRSTVNSVQAIESQGKIIILAASTQGNVYVFSVSCTLDVQPEQISLIPSHDIGNKIPLAISCTTLPLSVGFVLAIGVTSSSFYLFTSSDIIHWDNAAAIQGHTDWVRALAFSTPTSDNTFLLASGSQDHYVRLWKLSAKEPPQQTKYNDAKPSTSIEVLDTLEADETSFGLTLKQYEFKVKEQDFSCTSESVLWSHEDWITDLRWKPLVSSDSITSNILLSTSADRSMILWSFDPNTSLWVPSDRFGDLNSIGGGFFGALWGIGAGTILTHDWGGSFRRWMLHESLWSSKPGISGHFESVNDSAWEPEGDFLLSVSLDKTTRLHGPIHETDDALSHEQTWHELNRPQVHGYSINSVAFLSRTSFISGADESIVRVFEAPFTALNRIDKLGCAPGLVSSSSKVRPTNAIVPALGLSNRAAADGDENGEDEENRFQQASTSEELPLEEDLMKGTLWLEREKLYGHRYDIYATTTSRKHQLVASTCKSASAEHSAIRIHRTSDWTQVGQPLSGHNLTVTSMRFSPDESYLLSVSRDRGWCLFQYNTETAKFQLVAKLPKAHARIIWDCCWATDGEYFVTAARDKSIKVWKIPKVDNATPECERTISMKVAPTAVSLSRIPNQDGNFLDVLAVGCENGGIVFIECKDWNVMNEENEIRVHSGSITRLEFNPKGIPRLASCSDDRTVRVIDVIL